ncbi:MAG: DUF6703 family protein [Streptosporangiaceae bacterium]
MSGSRPGARRRPVPPGRTMYTPGATEGRQQLERRSAAPLVFLRQLPAWLIPVLFAVLVFGGLTVHGPVGAVLLVLAAVFLGWLAAVSWPRLTPLGRAGRGAIVALVLAVAVWQALR